MKNRIDEFQPCPLCGQTDRLSITEKGFYYKLMHNYGFAMVNIKCWRCDLNMAMYSQFANSNNYEILVGELKRRWAEFKR